MAKVKISVIIATHNRKKLLIRCLNCLWLQTYPLSKFEIIICDDASYDGTEVMVNALIKKHKNLFYFSQRKKGPGAARNLGIKNTKGEIVAFTDDDCLPAKNWLEQIDKAFRLNPKALGVEGKTICTQKKEDLFHYRVHNEKGGQYWTANIGYKKSALIDIGGFDESFTFFFEDADLSRRLVKKGKIIFAPPVVVRHPPREYKLSRELIRLYHITSEFRFYQKHKDWFAQFFPGKRDFQVYFLLIACNYIWFRIKRLKNSLNILFKKPIPWFKFFLRYLIELAFIVIIFPLAVLGAKRGKTKWQK